MVSTAQLAGYLLEEVVAHLLAANGYRILSAQDDQVALTHKGNGLRVRGRGAEHQADALGELTFTIPFTLPIRLFVEAKNTTAKVGLDVVRNAHGVLSDVNEYVRSATDQVTSPEHLRRVQYRYSIFATGGFTADAQSFAVAHQISLIDLSGPSWEPISTALREAADHAPTVGGQPDTAMLRTALRDALSRLSDGTTMRDQSEVDRWATSTVDSAFALNEEQEVFLGFIDAPFVLFLRSTNPQAFRRHAARRQGVLHVHIGFDRRGRERGEWRIQDADDPDAFDLTFALPGVLEEMLLGSELGYRQAARLAKQSLMQSITLYLDGAPVRMTYQRSRHSSDSIPESSSDFSPLRLAEPVLPDRTSRQVPESWTPYAVRELLNRLRSGSYVQEELIRFAATHGGLIAREKIYEIADYDEDRRLNGLVRPTNRITAQLVDEGILPAGIEPPFMVAEYDNAGWAVSYKVPQQIVEIVARKPLL